MRRMLVLLGVLTALVAGCTQTSGGTPVASDDNAEMPDDFAVAIVYRNGSVPPPYHYEWRLRVDEAGAELSWRPGYDEAEPPWVETVPVTGEQRVELYGRLREAGAFDPVPPTDDGMVGGSTGEVELTADGSTRGGGELGLSPDSQDVLDAVRVAAEDLVPAAVWTRMSGRQETWGEQHPG